MFFTPGTILSNKNKGIKAINVVKVAVIKIWQIFFVLEINSSFDEDCSAISAITNKGSTTRPKAIVIPAIIFSFIAIWKNWIIPIVQRIETG